MHIKTLIRFSWQFFYILVDTLNIRSSFQPHQEKNQHLIGILI